MSPGTIKLSVPHFHLIHQRENVKNVLSVWGQKYIFLHLRFFIFASGVQLKGTGESFLVSKDELLTPNIDGLMAL